MRLLMTLQQPMVINGSEDNQQEDGGDEGGSAMGPAAVDDVTIEILQ